MAVMTADTVSRAPARASQPLLAARRDHEHRLAGVHVLADLGDDHADDTDRAAETDKESTNVQVKPIVST